MNQLALNLYEQSSGSHGSEILQIITDIIAIAATPGTLDTIVITGTRGTLDTIVITGTPGTLDTIVITGILDITAITRILEKRDTIKIILIREVVETTETQLKITEEIISIIGKIIDTIVITPNLQTLTRRINDLTGEISGLDQTDLRIQKQETRSPLLMKASSRLVANCIYAQ